MKVLAIIDSFKGTLSSRELGELTKSVLSKRKIKCDYLAISDGGDGFLECLESIIKVKRIYCKVNDPLFRTIDSFYLFDESSKTAYVEMALASGINLLKKEELNPYLATTYGTGELIMDAIQKKARKIIIGIGGSATNDGGTGLLEAMGVNFYSHNLLLQKMNGDKLGFITDIDDVKFQKTINGIEFITLNDVKNPLLGNLGATRVFSKQKGSNSEDIFILETKMRNYANICTKKFNKDNNEFPGSGAAGGMGYAIKTFFNAPFYQGTEYILDLINFEKIICNYDYIITGEGKIDNQSLLGKVIFAIKKKTSSQEVILVCAINELSPEEIVRNNIKKIYSIVPSFATIEESMNNPAKHFKILCENIELK